MENGRSGSCASTHVAELIDFASAFVATMLLFDRSTQWNRVIVVYVRHVATSWPPNGDLSVTTLYVKKSANETGYIQYRVWHWTGKRCSRSRASRVFARFFLSFFFFRIHISTLYIFIYPWWQKDNFCRMIRIIVILVLDSKLLNQSKFEKEFSSSPFSNFPFFLCPSSFIYVITYPIRNNYPYPKNSNSRSVLTREEFELASIQRRMQSYRHGSCILAQSYCAHQLTALMP